MTDDADTLMRLAAFDHVRRLGKVLDHLTAEHLKLRVSMGRRAHGFARAMRTRCR
jgi:hypothetical protein